MFWTTVRDHDSMAAPWHLWPLHSQFPQRGKSSPLRMTHSWKTPAPLVQATQGWACRMPVAWMWQLIHREPVPSEVL